MYLLDTDWIIQALARREPAARTLYELSGSRVHVSIITVGELYEGAFGTAHPQARLISVRQFLDQYRVLNLSDPVMEQFAKTRALLRRRGQLISNPGDLWGVDT
jgi:predicted nucleic acid-binding protein